ncbi:CLOCK-interacting pacemaker [Eleutherodactylus coqui]|uniref:CLOCK-interacting pacemaker n=1 Tax=Eleutherodactylus coqui TaxID=57060 RepID=UPI003461FBB1
MEKLQPGSSQEKLPPSSCNGTAQKNHPRNTCAASESDKDSGYSDVASECLSSVEQTDTEEYPSSSHWSTGKNSPRCSASCPPPLLVLKNLLVDQGIRPEPHAQSWAVHPSFQLLPTSSQILVFPSSIPASKPQPICKNSTKYLPILNSYTKIAPHPSQLSSSLAHPKANKRGADTSHHSQAKRLPPGLQCCTAKGKATSHVSETNVQKAVMLSDELSPTTPLKDTCSSDSLTTDRAISSQNTSYNKDEALPAQQQQNKNCRFQNTMDILRRSGLLSIAMKTKELARLNQATQVQLERLQEQVDLYTKANCSNDPEDWQILQDSLAGSHLMLKEIDM